MRRRCQPGRKHLGRGGRRIVRHALAVLLVVGAAHLRAQAPAADSSAQPAADPATQQPYQLQAGTSLILVPATVDIKGKLVYTLTADQFTLTDDGVPRRFRLEQDADTLGLSVVVVVQCSRSAVAEYGKIEQLPTMIESLTGAAPHEVALVRYGSHPQLVQPFTRKTEKISAAMAGMGPCEDDKAATMDALSYAAAILENRDPRSRRAILLISETRDHGSSVKEANVIAQLGRNNIVVDSFAFSPYRDSMKDELKPGHGAGLFGTAVNFLFAAVQALKQNVPKTVARLSGGEYDNFATKRGFEDGVGRLTNRIHNYYLLSFTVPGTATEGLHELKVTVPDYPEATIRARRTYWVGPVPNANPEGTQQTTPELPDATQAQPK